MLFNLTSKASIYCVNNLKDISMFLRGLMSITVPTNRSVIQHFLFRRGCSGFIRDRPSRYVNFQFARRPSLKVQNTITKNSFHTTKSYNSPLTIIRIILGQTLKFAAVFTGTGLRIWWSKLPKFKRRHYRQKIAKQKYKIYIGSALSAGLVFVYYAMHVTEDPITKRKRFILFSENQMRQITMIALNAVMKEYENKIVSSGYQYTYVLGIAQRILQANKDLPGTDKPWQLLIIDDKEIRNAFVLPSGHIFITTGMLSIVNNNDDQLAIILGHEIAHVLLRHGAESISQSHLLQMVFFLPILAIWSLFPASVAVTSHYLTTFISQLLINLPFGRSKETEADAVGLQMISRACFDPKEAIMVWKKMEKIVEQKTIEWFSTHPHHDTRYATLDAQIPEAIQTFAKFCKRDSDPRLLR